MKTHKAYLEVLEQYPAHDKNSSDFRCLDLVTGKKIIVDLFTDGHLPIDYRDENLKGAKLVADISPFLWMGNGVRPMSDKEIFYFNEIDKKAKGVK